MVDNARDIVVGQWTEIRQLKSWWNGRKRRRWCTGGRGSHSCHLFLEKLAKRLSTDVMRRGNMTATKQGVDRLSQLLKT